MRVICYACVTIECCKECGQEVEVEGVAYTYEDINCYETWVQATLYEICPICCSHRVEWD